MKPEQQPNNNSPQVSVPSTQESSKRNPKRLVFVGLLVVAIIATGTVLWKVLSSDNGTVKPSSSTSTEETLSQAAVNITEDGFSPATLKIKKGTTVTWTNQDDVPHQVASDPHPTHEGLAGLDSEEPLTKADAYNFTFETAGTFTYHDHLNFSIFQGTIVVE
jgi:plastocyanin